MRIYIAAPYPLREEAVRLMVGLERLGVQVTSTWLKSDEAMRPEHALIDLRDLVRADAVVALEPPTWADRGTGGRHVEFGCALMARKPVVLIGGRQGNVFHLLPGLEVLPYPVTDLAEVLAALINARAVPVPTC